MKIFMVHVLFIVGVFLSSVCFAETGKSDPDVASVMDHVSNVDAQVIILDNGKTSAAVVSGSEAVIYGTAGANAVQMASGSVVTLLHFLDENEVSIDADSTIFTVRRSGAMVNLEGTDGTSLSIPATPNVQQIIFNDATFALAIDAAGVKLNDQIITTQTAAVKNDAGDPTTYTYPVVDTGQVLFFDDATSIDEPVKGDDFYGQDANFSGNPFDYTSSEDGLTVYDNITGLTWTKSPDIDRNGDINVDDKLDYDGFLQYPNTLNAISYGGYNDWRAPTIKELYSLMNFSGTDNSGMNSVEHAKPFIDTDYFDFGYGDTDAGERTIDAQFWSINVYTGLVFDHQGAAFGLNLADGRIKGYPHAANEMKIKCYVYFVRGNTQYGMNDFGDNNDGTVTDNATGLMWSRDDSGKGMNWQDALAWVQQKNAENYLGYGDWRLPNAKEMHSILDYARAPDATGSAAIDPIFNITQIINEKGEADYPWFWTGTTHKRNNSSGTAAVYICFGRAMGYMNGKWMDVHGAGAQRSDEKDGDFSGLVYVEDGYYSANAPQGDAQRLENYVRLVRTDD